VRHPLDLADHDGVALARVSLEAERMTHFVQHRADQLGVGERTLPPLRVHVREARDPDARARERGAGDASARLLRERRDAAVDDGVRGVLTRRRVDRAADERERDPVRGRVGDRLERNAEARAVPRVQRALDRTPLGRGRIGRQ